jgi:hypothetical protein
MAGAGSRRGDDDARIRKRAHKLWRAAGRPAGGAGRFVEEAKMLIAIEDNPKAGTKSPNAGYNKPGPWGEPIEEAQVALENEGEFPTITDQGEQKIPQIPPPDDGELPAAHGEPAMTAEPKINPGPEIELRIRERAYQLWIEEGRPHGRDQEHWEKARKQVEAENGQANPSKAAIGATFTDAVTAAIDPALKTKTAAKKKRSPKSAKA